jgi:hypothetical protein
MAPNRTRLSLAFALLATCSSAPALDRTWIGGNVDWVDAGSTANWTPADEPDSDDRAIFNTANTVNLGSNNAVNGLTMSGGIDLNTNNQDLTVDGLLQLTGASTNFIVGDASSAVQADSVTIDAGGNLQMAGGQLTVIEETGNGLFDINAGGTLSGHGVVVLSDALLAATTIVFNDGTISASHPGFLFSPPVVDTLSISLSSGNARIDLDGVGGAGIVTVGRNQTVDINGTLSDSFSGTINLFHNSTLDISSAWTLDTGTISATNGFVDGGIFPSTSADISVIAGGELTQTGGTISVVDDDGTLRFDAPFTMNGGTLTNNGLVIFNNNATIAAGANFALGAGSDFTVGAGRTVTINQTNFNMDGSTSGASTVTVNAGGLLTINVSDYDPDSITNRFDGVITLNSGDIDVSSADAEFIMDGTLNMNSTTMGLVTAWEGEPLDVGDDVGALDARVFVTGAQTSRLATQVDFNSDADVNIAAGAELQISGTTIFQSVNGTNNAEFTGAGTFAFNGQVDVLEATTLNMVGGTVDLDGVDGFGDFINVDAPLTINAAVMSSFGKMTGGGGANTIDVNNSVGTGVLTVNLDDPVAEWTLNAPGVMNLVNDNTAATLLAGSDVNIIGTLNVTGDVRTTARLDIGSTGVVNINTAGQPLRLAGGNNANDTNTIAGGVINGPGVLAADNVRGLHGFGTINTAIDFDGSANLRADNGMLTINGAINDVNTLGTNDADGVLNIPAPWNTGGGVAAVELNGGVLQGGTITNDGVNGVSGDGTVTSRVINNSLLGANGGGTLVVQTAANDNDWDGAGAGQLRGVNSSTLELRDVGAAFGFTGTVLAQSGGRVFANGFALDFNPGSTLTLSNGTYESTNTTGLGGTVTVNAGGPSRIKVANNFFVNFEGTSVTTLNGDLQLDNNNITIDVAATFSGPGALHILPDSFARAEPNANVNVLVRNDGVFHVGGIATVGRNDMRDYQQGATGELEIDISGTALNLFDRLIVNGQAQLLGTLDLRLRNGFDPAVGNSFTILSATGGVTGVFNDLLLPNLGPNRSWAVNYTPNSVIVSVTPFNAGDFTGDGKVDGADLSLLLSNWGGSVPPVPAGWNGAQPTPTGVDANELSALLGNWGFGTSSASAVPEPSGALLVLVGLAARQVVVGRRRRETR